MTNNDSDTDFEIDTGSDDGPNLPDRDHVLALLANAMHETHRKIDSGRVRDAENEKVRQGWIRQLGYLAGQYRQLKKDEDLEELDERLSALESDTNTGTGSSGGLPQTATRKGP